MNPQRTSARRCGREPRRSWLAGGVAGAAGRGLVRARPRAPGPPDRAGDRRTRSSGGPSSSSRRPGTSSSTCTISPRSATSRSTDGESSPGPISREGSSSAMNRAQPGGAPVREPRLARRAPTDGICSFASQLRRPDERQVCDLALRRGDGSEFEGRLLCRFRALDDAAAAVQVAITDVTVEKRAQALALAPERMVALRAAIDALPIGVTLVELAPDDTPRFVTHNSAYDRNSASISPAASSVRGASRRDLQARSRHPGARPWSSRSPSRPDGRDGVRRRDPRLRGRSVEGLLGERRPHPEERPRRPAPRRRGAPRHHREGGAGQAGRGGEGPALPRPRRVERRLLRLGPADRAR